MTEEKLKHSLRLFRYGGVVVTVVVFVVLLAFSVFANGLMKVTTIGADGKSTLATAQLGDTLSAMLPYILVITLATAVLAIVFFFVYAAVLRGQIKKD
jgi:hypothetical protein